MKKEKNVMPLCNKKPERAPHIFGRTFILCWRCSMVVLGTSIAYLLMNLSLIEINTSIYVILILILPMLIDGCAQYFFKIESTNFRRALTGFVFGAAISIIAYTYL